MSEALQSLIERVEKATGPDREIDCLIHEWQKPELTPDMRCTYYGEPTGEYYDPKPNTPGSYIVAVAEKYTSSLDAALSLVARVLPAWFPSIGQNIHYGHWRGSVRMVEETNGDIISFDGEHRTSPALALCLALLRAVSTVQAKEHSNV